MNTKHPLSHLHELIKSGIQSNIELAFQLAEANNIAKDVLLKPWDEIIELLFLREEYEDEIELLYYLLNEKSISLFLPEGEEVPTSIVHLPFVEALDVSNNDLRSLPDEVCQLTQLKSLEVHGNRLNKLPQDIGKLTQLKYLYLQENPLFSTELDRIKQLFPHAYIKLW